VGYQACGMKRQVFRPMRNFLQVREFFGKKKHVVKPISNSLQVREVAREVISPGGIPTTALLV
jgi:hypothetical protein